MKKFLAVLLAIAMLFTIAAPAYAAGTDDAAAAVSGVNGFLAKIYDKIHDLLHIFVKAFGLKCPFCGKTIVVAKPGNVDEVLDKAKNGETVEFAAGDYGTITLNDLNGVTLEADESVNVDKFVTTAESELKDVTLTGFDFEIAAVNRDCGISIDYNATIENLVIDDATFVGENHKSSCGIFGNNPTATLTVKNSTFENMGYALWSTSSNGYGEITIENCTFNNLNSWVVLLQYGTFAGNSTITGCTFTKCVDGVAKHGTLAADKTFTFTNNTLDSECRGHDGKEAKWFEIKTANSVVEGNTLAGAEWIPGAAQGLKAA